MSYWLPRFCLLLTAFVALSLGVFSFASDEVVHTLMIVAIGLGLFALTLKTSPHERS